MTRSRLHWIVRSVHSSRPSMTMSRGCESDIDSGGTSSDKRIKGSTMSRSIWVSSFLENTSSTVWIDSSTKRRRLRNLSINCNASVGISLQVLALVPWLIAPEKEEASCESFLLLKLFSASVCASADFPAQAPPCSQKILDGGGPCWCWTSRRVIACISINKGIEWTVATEQIQLCFVGDQMPNFKTICWTHIHARSNIRRCWTEKVGGFKTEEPEAIRVDAIIKKLYLIVHIIEVDRLKYHQTSSWSICHQRLHWGTNLIPEIDHSCILVWPLWNGSTSRVTPEDEAHERHVDPVVSLTVRHPENPAAPDANTPLTGKVVEIIMSSSTPLATLVHLSQNFPKYATSLSRRVVMRSNAAEELLIQSIERCQRVLVEWTAAWHEGHQPFRTLKKEKELMDPHWTRVDEESGVWVVDAYRNCDKTNGRGWRHFQCQWSSRRRWCNCMVEWYQKGQSVCSFPFNVQNESLNLYLTDMLDGFHPCYMGYVLHILLAKGQC